MEQNDLELSVKKRLILSGLKELEEHGITDFSLRRVAAMAQVSCAAPYRHFKDKEELILSIISHVREGWTLLAEEITAHSARVEDRIKRISIAAVRFWIANSNFRSVLIAGVGDSDRQRRDELTLFDTPVITAASLYAESCGKDERALCYTILALIYGSVTLVEEGIFSADEVVSLLELKLSEELK